MSRIPEGYKESEAGVIPNDWDAKSVGLLCDFIVPGRNKPKAFFGEIPWITTPDIENNGTIFFSKQNLTITKEEAKKIGSKIVPQNSIIISCVGEIGLVAVAGRDIVINQQLHAFIPRKDVFYRFLLYSLSIKKKYMDKVATKTAVPYMNKDNCNSIPIAFPALPEQLKISAVLSEIDEEILIVNKLVLKKDLQKKALMQQLLTGKKRLKGFDAEWDNVSFKNAFTFIKSYSISREGLKTDEFEEGIHCIHYGDIHAFYEHEFLDFFSQKKIPKIKSKNTQVKESDYLEEGDIILADASEDYEGVGETVEVLGIGQKRAVGGLHTIVLRGINNKTANGFRAYLFASEKVRNELRKKATGTSVYSITKTTLESLFFKLPSIKEQNAIASILITANKEIQLLKAKADKLKDQKKGMMELLLTGKKRLKI